MLVRRKMLLDNRVAIITGGARGIGKGIALKFAEEGCSVAIADIQIKEAEKTVLEILDKGVQALAIECDATNSSQVQDMVDKVIEKFGKIDILVNNTGGFGPMISVTEISEKEWERVVNLNVKGTFLCSKAVAPHMIKNRYGKIINISSVAAISTGPPNIHYSTAKGGVLSFTIGLAGELAPYNICVNAILPGVIQTTMWDPSVPAGADKDAFFKQLAKANIPLGRAGTPEDVGLVALFFASELSRYVTGDRLNVGGGLPLTPPPIS
jgi:NAD(P)-dependent dehydrogenase (short-subunit alcohol dehydrogenase family)